MEHWYIDVNTTIRDIAELVFVGLSTHGRSIALSDEEVKGYEERGIEVRSLPLLTPSAFRGNKLCFDNLDTVYFSSAHFARYCIQAGDVLAVCRGTLFRSAVVPTSAPQCVIASSLIAVRLNRSMLLPELLCAYLNDSSVLETLVRKSNSSTSALSVSVKNIEGVRIRVPDASVQERLCEIYDAAMAHHDLSTEIADALLMQSRSLVSSHVEVQNG